MIDKEELLNIFLKWRKIDIELHGEELEWEPSLVLRAVNEAPEINAAPVVRGEWEVAIGYDPNKKVQCQNCYKMAYEPTPYCPNCGAKMDLNRAEAEAALGKEGDQI